MLAEELALHVENKKANAFRSIEEFAASLRTAYIDALANLEEQNSAHIKKEIEYAKEIKMLAQANSDLLRSLEIETEDHKKTIAQLKHKNIENDSLKKELDILSRKNLDLADAIDNQAQDLAKKSIMVLDMSEQIKRLEQENEILAAKAQKLKDIVGKSASAYSQIANDSGIKPTKLALPELSS